MGGWVGGWVGWWLVVLFNKPAAVHWRLIWSNRRSTFHSKQLGFYLYIPLTIILVTPSLGYIDVNLSLTLLAVPVWFGWGLDGWHQTYFLGYWHWFILQTPFCLHLKINGTLRKAFCSSSLSTTIVWSQHTIVWSSVGRILHIRLLSCISKWTLGISNTSFGYIFQFWQLSLCDHKHLFNNKI